MTVTGPHAVRDVIFVSVRTAVAEVYGGEYSTIATARALRERGLVPHFIITADDDMARELRGAGFPVEIVPIANPFDGLRTAPFRDQARRLGEILRLNLAVARRARALGGAIVHTAGVPTFLGSWLGARLGRGRIVFHVRGASTNQQTRGPEELAMLAADRTIAVSESLREQLVGTARRWLRPLLVSRVGVVHNGFDFVEIDAILEGTTREAAREAVGPAEAGPLAVLVGGLWRDKGQLRFIEQVMPQVLAHVPDFRLQLIGGVKDAAYVSELHAAVHRLGLERHVIFTGYRPMREVYRHYRAADLAVLPTEREGLPRTLIEASSFGLPVVATAVVGSVDVVREGETGYLVPNDRVEEMAPRIVQICNDPALRRRLGEAGAALVRREYSIERNVRAIVAVYEALQQRA